MRMLETIGDPPASPEPRAGRRVESRGGTFTMVGGGDVEHLDPALAYHTVTRGILRACTRQLVGHASSRDRQEAGRIVADLATEVPTVGNGRITDGGTRFAFSLRDDVYWHTPSGLRRI